MFCTQPKSRPLTMHIVRLRISVFERIVQLTISYMSPPPRVETAHPTPSPTYLPTYLIFIPLLFRFRQPLVRVRRG